MFSPRVVFAVCLSWAASGAVAQERPLDPGLDRKGEAWLDARWNDTDVGPFLASVLAPPGGAIAKGFSIRVGDKQQASVVYDLHSATLRASWAGGFLKFDPFRFGVARTPVIDGQLLFQCSQHGWGDSPVRHDGIYQHGQRVVLAYRVGDVRVLEHPWVAVGESVWAISRSFQIEPHKSPLVLSLVAGARSATLAGHDDCAFAHCQADDRLTCIGVRRNGRNDSAAQLQVEGDVIRLVIPSSEAETRLDVLICSGQEDDEDEFAALVTGPHRPTNMQMLMQPGPVLWPQELVTRGVVSSDRSPYVIDTVTVPFDNPYNALMFIGGHDFFSNGDLAACTLHGDVWLIRGVDQSLERVTWRRFATGLHQPLGLKIVDDKVYVLGRDQITRLHDRDNNGEADFYENFNSDSQVSSGGHDYAACLQTDAAGNFYSIRAIEGVARVSADGSRHEVIASGFRNPIGLGVGPGGIITAAPQEGNWTPASSIVEVRHGGYYGFEGPNVTPERPLGYDPPLCWLPRVQDNSSGGQVWVTSDRWGPLEGQLLHLSYGQCALMLVLRENLDGAPQGGTIRFPLFFDSGVMRGRFRPLDGHLYVSGMRGWQTSAASDGCIQRVRYTGAPLDMPIALGVTPSGLSLTFTRPLDELAASDPDNYDIQWWNYRYSKDYGSKDYRVSEPQRFGHDEVYVEDAKLSADGRTVTLELEEMRPVMQMQITYSIQAFDGAAIKHTIYNTINAVPRSP